MNLLYVLMLSYGPVNADEISIPMRNSSAKPGDTIVFTESCETKDVPFNQDGVKIEKNGTQGKIMVGTPWTGVRVSKGYEAFELQVIHNSDKDPIALVKSGQANTPGSPFRTMGCRHTKKFKIYSVDANPPCGSGTENLTDTPAGR